MGKQDARVTDGISGKLQAMGLHWTSSDGVNVTEVHDYSHKCRCAAAGNRGKRGIGWVATSAGA